MMPRRQVAYVGSVFQLSEEPINYKVDYNVVHYHHEIQNSKYNILYVNIHSMKDFDDLEEMIHNLHKHGVEIYIVAVTKINIDAETSKYHNLPDYNSYYSINSNGEGGVALYIHKSLSSGLIENFENEDIDCLIVNIPRLNLNVGILYKCPTESIESYYNAILRENQRTILFSDVNIDLLKSNASTRWYTGVVRDHQFSILNQIDRASATRNTSPHNDNGGCSIVDHVLSNVKKFKYTLSLCNAPISDNKMIVLGFDDNKPEKIEFVAEPDVITYQMVDYQMFNRNFSGIDLRSISSIDELVSEMKKCKRNSTVTRERRRSSRNRPWIYANSTNRCEMRSEAYARKMNRFDDESKKLWNIINEYLTNKSSSNHSIDAIYNKTDQIVVDKKEIANILNAYFMNIGKDLYKRIPRMMNVVLPAIDENRNCINTITTTTKEVLEKIDLMKNNNNFRDSIPSNTLKFHKYKLAPLLARLFNDIFHTGEYPYSLKIDRIVPAYKTDDPLQPDNYRPISIQPSLSKLMESIMCDQITEFCNKNRIIDKDQYGWQKNSSSLSAVVSIVDYLQVGLNTTPDSIGACLFIDLKKASNTIPHDLFMKKLHRIGIRGSLYNLIESYLHERHQYIDLGSVLSEVAINTNAFSIPQGSALGPLFFLLYVNDIFKMKIHGKIILSGDDTAIAYVETDPDALKRYMEKDLRELNKWFTKNGLTMNEDKTKAMLFNADNNNLHINLKVRDKKVEFVTTHKYLGIHLQDNLKWDVQINKIIREIHAAANSAKMIGNHVNENISWTMYHALVYNRLSKMASIYGKYATKIQLQRLQAAQNMAIKNLFPGINAYNINAFYINNKVLKVEHIINYDLALLMYKYLNNLNKLNRPLNTNGNNILSIAARYYQTLPRSIQNKHDVNQFKRSFKAFCVNSYEF